MKIEDLFEAVKPTIWYHGSNTKIEEFHLINVSNPDATHQEGPGIYLTSSIDDARRYGKFIHVVKAKLAKSRTMPDNRKFGPDFIRRLISLSPDKADALSNWDENPSKAMNMAVSSIIDSYGPSDYRQALEQVWADFYMGHEDKWLSKLRVFGWDGFIVQQSGLQHLICFNPEILTIQEVHER